MIFSKFQTLLALILTTIERSISVSLVVLNFSVTSDNESMFTIYDGLFKTFNDRYLSFTIQPQSKYPSFV